MLHIRETRNQIIFAPGKFYVGNSSKDSSHVSLIKQDKTREGSMYLGLFLLTEFDGEICG
jgi:hypothetical protein